MSGAGTAGGWRVIARPRNWAEGKRAAQGERDGGENALSLWSAQPGSSERRGRARWRCSAHEQCGVVLSLEKEAGHGFILLRNDAQHTNAPVGGAKR